MLVVYEGMDEVIVFEKKKEKKYIKIYFKEGGRELEEYGRTEGNDVHIHPQINAYIGRK